MSYPFLKKLGLICFGLVEEDTSTLSFFLPLLYCTVKDILSEIRPSHVYRETKDHHQEYFVWLHAVNTPLDLVTKKDEKQANLCVKSFQMHFLYNYFYLPPLPHYFQESRWKPDKSWHCIMRCISREVSAGIREKEQRRYGRH